MFDASEAFGRHCLDASVGATEAGWRAALEQVVDVTDARKVPISYNTTIFGSFYNYSHPVVCQIFEKRYLPVAAVVLFAISLVPVRRLLKMERKHDMLGDETPSAAESDSSSSRIPACVGATPRVKMRRRLMHVGRPHRRAQTAAADGDGLG